MQQTTHVTTKPQRTSSSCVCSSRLPALDTDTMRPSCSATCWFDGFLAGKCGNWREAHVRVSWWSRGTARVQAVGEQCHKTQSTNEAASSLHLNTPELPLSRTTRVAMDTEMSGKMFGFVWCCAAQLCRDLSSTHAQSQLLPNISPPNVGGPCCLCAATFKQCVGWASLLTILSMLTQLNIAGRHKHDSTFSLAPTLDCWVVAISIRWCGCLDVLKRVGLCWRCMRASPPMLQSQHKTTLLPTPKHQPAISQATSNPRDLLYLKPKAGQPLPPLCLC